MSIFFAFIGLVLGLYIGGGENIWSMLLSALAGLFLFPLSIKRKAWIPYICFILLGICLTLIRLIPCSEGTSFTGCVIESKDNYFVLMSGFRRYYVYANSNKYEVGDILSIEGSASSFSFTTYESRFDFGKYLISKGVSYEISSKKITIVFSNPLHLRALEDSFLSHFSDDASGLLSSLLFNRKDSSSSLISSASSLSLLSVYSSSGIIFSILLRGFERLLEPKLGRKSRKAVLIIASTIIMPFNLWKIGVWRVYISGIIRFVNEFAFEKKFSSLEVRCLSGFALLTMDFHFAYQTGFLLGYGISLILYFTRMTVERLKKRWRPFASTGLIHLCIFPSHVYSSHGIHFLSLIYCLVSIPLLVPFVVLGWLSFFSVPFVSLLNGYGEFLRRVLSLFSYVDLFVPLPILHPLWAFLYYLILILSLYFLEIGGHIFYKAGSLFLLCAYSLSLLPISSLLTDQVSFVNVGQGDAILIRDNLTTVMIDTGGNLSFDMAEEVLIPYLRKERIYTIDCLIASHGDFDHIGAKDSLLSNYNVKRYVEEASSFPLTIGNLTFVNYNTYGGSEENESSLVLGLTFMGKKWLFMGDAPTSIEKRIVEDNGDIDCDILKVGHHGSDTSTSSQFIDKVTPEEAIISVGANNKYGHPKDSVLKILRSRGVKIRRTDIEGTISYRKMSLWWV